MKLLTTPLYILLALLIISCEPLDLTQYATITNTIPNEEPEEEVSNFSIAFSGDGTSSSPYLISSVSDLELLSVLVASGESSSGIYFQLTTDLNLNGSSTNQWTPIGNSTTPFKGTFDGDDHLISGIYINSSDDYIGLFGYTYTATIKNVGVSGTIIGNQYVGGVVGYTSSSTVSNCYNSGDVSGSEDYVGGVVGYNYYYSTVSNCYNSGDVSGSEDYVGGVVGYNYSSSTVSNCYNMGDVSGSSYVGGVVGYTLSSTVSNCYWLSGCCADGDDYGTEKSESEMKESAMLTLLNASQSDVPWVFDTYSVNSGYPILSWQ